ncbi:cytochrome P450 [Streptacidiphilus sp. P02-A3a]|uniref:cytochrome P450 n=1 Tax=Streptacidiphilus sp. P02-A3a TaxID=2704468 RepID=UPI0015FE2FDB|nr:cytochrome P450 [Streptacidiphilus sp. P02-A3a]QMU71462.1 cytochrome P450 [Streptacidiphilus sp. P02-A3a]
MSEPSGTPLQQAEPAQSYGRERELAASVLAELFGSEAARADPYPYYQQLRQADPVHVADSGRLYLTRYADCAASLRDPRLLGQSPDWMDKASPGWREHPAVVQNIESVLFRDPPDHTRLRRLVNRSFTPRRVARMREDVVRLVHRSLDRLADAGGGGSTVDAYGLLAATLPIAVVGTLIGIPERDWAQLHDPASAVMQVVEVGVGEDALERADEAAVGLNAYFEDLIAQRRRDPRPDIISDLIASADAGGDPEQGGAGMSAAELLRMTILLFGAGVDTTVGLLSNGLVALLGHPRQAELLRADPGLAENTVTEVLRWDSPTQVIVRVAGPGAVVAGHQVPEDGTVFALTGAAHRDPEQFADPDTFDITRTGSPVLSFSGGIHYCVGAPLARLEAEVFFPALLDRFPKLALTGRPLRRGYVVRGYDSLPVTVG